ncbi:hypothetical protein BGW36DRAFT_99434 [Talaromyces proteolyticus]|uniref:Rhodopsin domain-containing protein n=1 Tax=Talaromyces proteolyticus TaxID=1131652 RepID=A0AAD4L629_9EURO|nr:uncharacterized protein BGW36DRAFT_99434 [Talaromyces proteolyticus]KAH8704232.1 hypothetical protein BGW36DRAFT_99434 [Talaromyces proteolyticus]
MGQASGPAIVAVIWTFVSISSILVAARLYTRLRIVNKIGLDDYIMAFSLICCHVFAGLVTASISWGMASHMDDLSTQQKANAFFYSSASFTPGILSFTIPKLGVAALLIRILNPTRRFTWFLWTFVGVSDLLIFGCVIILYAQCNPSRATWTPSMTDAVCWSPAVLENYSIASGALSAFLDLFLAMYPATVLWRLQMNRRKKIGLSATLGLGIFACAVSIYKATRLPELGNKADYTYATSEVFLWTSIEANTIIQAACIPTIAPLLESLLGRKVFSSRSAEHTSSYFGASGDVRKNSKNNWRAPRKQSLPGSQNWPSAARSGDHSRLSDVESQKSILGEDGIPLSHITRKDEFSIQFEAATQHGLERVRDGRPPSVWRRSLLKYGTPP